MISRGKLPGPVALVPIVASLVAMPMLGGCSVSGCSRQGESGQTEELPTEPFSKRVAPGDEGVTTHTVWVSAESVADGAKAAGFDKFDLPESVTVSGRTLTCDESTVMNNSSAVTVIFSDGELSVTVGKWHDAEENPIPGSTLAESLLNGEKPDEWELVANSLKCSCYGNEKEHLSVLVCGKADDSDYGYVIMGSSKVMLTDEEVIDILSRIG